LEFQDIGPEYPDRIHPDSAARLKGERHICSFGEGRYAVRRAAIEKAGGFADFFWHAYEGPDLAIRIWDVGYRCLAWYDVIVCTSLVQSIGTGGAPTIFTPATNYLAASCERLFPWFSHFALGECSRNFVTASDAVWWTVELRCGGTRSGCFRWPSGNAGQFGRRLCDDACMLNRHPVAHPLDAWALGRNGFRTNKPTPVAVAPRLSYERLLLTDMITSKGRRSSIHLDLIRGLGRGRGVRGALTGSVLRGLPGTRGTGTVVRRFTWRRASAIRAVMIFLCSAATSSPSSIVQDWVQWSWKKYLTDRLVRLYLVLLPGLALTAGWDWVGQTWGNSGITRVAFPAMCWHIRPPSGPTLARSLVNVAFLQTVLAPPYGTNSPLWSICNEFWYYIVFPCLALVVAGSSSILLRAAYAIGAVAISHSSALKSACIFWVWLSGSAVRLAPPVFGRRHGLGELPPQQPAPRPIIALLFSRLIPGFLAWDFLVGLTFAAWMFLCFTAEREDSASWYSVPIRRLAGCSFSLYVLHLPILAALYSLTVGSGRWAPDVRHMLGAAANWRRGLCVRFGLGPAYGGQHEVQSGMHSVQGNNGSRRR